MTETNIPICEGSIDFKTERRIVLRGAADQGERVFFEWHTATRLRVVSRAVHGTKFAQNQNAEIVMWSHECSHKRGPTEIRSQVLIPDVMPIGKNSVMVYSKDAGGLFLNLHCVEVEENAPERLRRPEGPVTL